MKIEELRALLAEHEAALAYFEELGEMPDDNDPWELPATAVNALPALLDVAEAAEAHREQWDDPNDPAGASDLDRALYAALKRLEEV